jgi:hypothetical protein
VLCVCKHCSCTYQNQDCSCSSTHFYQQKDSYQAHKQEVIESLASARSGITISFDGWKAKNDALDLLGVIAHHIRSGYKLYTVVFSLHNTLRVRGPRFATKWSAKT